MGFFMDGWVAAIMSVTHLCKPVQDYERLIDGYVAFI